MNASVFAPTPSERLSRARSDLRMGLPVALRTPDGLWLACAAERVNDRRLRAFLDGTSPQLALTAKRAQTLKIRVYDGDLVRLPLSHTADAAWIAAMIDPTRDLATPMKGPFFPLRGGDTATQRAALILLRQAEVLPAAILMPVATVPEDATLLALDDIAGSERDLFRDAVSARLPIAATPDTRLHVFQPEAGGPDHYAVEIGRIDRTAPVLTRLHSACFTGDVLGSLKCDCGAQLNAALAQMAAAGGGVLLYLNQEGRGIGLANKMRAYALQDQGFDTVIANHRLGFDDDERDFGVGATLLRHLRIPRIRLLTNNPRKLHMLGDSGIDVVERVPLWVGETKFNRDYLRIKTTRSGHLE